MSHTAEARAVASWHPLPEVLRRRMHASAGERRLEGGEVKGGGGGKCTDWTGAMGRGRNLRHKGGRDGLTISHHQALRQLCGAGAVHKACA